MTSDGARDYFHHRWHIWRMKYDVLKPAFSTSTLSVVVWRGKLEGRSRETLLTALKLPLEWFKHGFTALWEGGKPYRRGLDGHLVQRRLRWWFWFLRLSLVRWVWTWGWEFKKQAFDKGQYIHRNGDWYLCGLESYEKSNTYMERGWKERKGTNRDGPLGRNPGNIDRFYNYCSIVAFRSQLGCSGGTINLTLGAWYLYTRKKIIVVPQPQVCWILQALPATRPSNLEILSSRLRNQKYCIVHSKSMEDH